MKYQCTKCGARRVSTRPVKASCKDFEISDAQTPKNPEKRSLLRKIMRHSADRATARLKKYHQFCTPNYHKFDFAPIKKTLIKAT